MAYEQELEKALEAMEELAHNLANANRVEAAWAVRGILEAMGKELGGQEPEGPGPLYRREWSRGFHAAAKALEGL
jgi:hypothetical protein